MGRPLGSKNKVKTENLQDVSTKESTAAVPPIVEPALIVSTAVESGESYKPRSRTDRKNRQTTEGRLLSASSQLIEVARLLKELAEGIRDSQDALIKKLKEDVLNQ